MSLPPAVRNVTDALASVDETIAEFLMAPGSSEVDGHVLFLIMAYGRAAAHTLDDILALYPELTDQDEEEIWHQASL